MAKKDEPAKESPHYFYNCAHGSSNQACQLCFPGQEDVPDDWMNTYVPPKPPGLTDEADLGAGT